MAKKVEDLIQIEFKEQGATTVLVHKSLFELLSKATSWEKDPSGFFRANFDAVKDAGPPVVDPCFTIVTPKEKKENESGEAED